MLFYSYLIIEAGFEAALSGEGEGLLGCFFLMVVSFTLDLCSSYVELILNLCLSFIWLNMSQVQLKIICLANIS